MAFCVGVEQGRQQANAGDSRSIMSRNGEAEPLSFDHKPVNRTEKSRIVAAGGFVEFGRVNGQPVCRCCWTAPNR